MFCDEVLEAVEPIAAGELAPSPRIAEHLASCRGCAGALDSARRLDALLRARAAPVPPAHFSSRVMNGLRRARWRTEQMLDWGFNLALVAAGVVVVISLWVVMRRSGLTTVSSDAIELLGPGMVLFARRVTPSLPLYLAATALLGTALGVWWWAERDTAL
jgi:predicted anti-sigma-YlaC factor YlaD